MGPINNVLTDEGLYVVVGGHDAKGLVVQHLLLNYVI